MKNKFYHSWREQILGIYQKNDVLSYASKLNKLRPEVAQQVIAQFPIHK